MNDYISREKALQFRLSVNASREASRVTVACGVADAIAEYIKAIPAADVRPVVRGEWTDKRTIEHDGEWYCTACGKEITIYMGADRKDRYAFCPNCGAKMGGVKRGTD